MLVNITSLVPNGLVIFFPSYAFLDQAKSVWEASGVLNRLGSKKFVFSEPRGDAPEGLDVESVLREYSEAARNGGGDGKKGAILFAVVGGKVSEGLNFNGTFLPQRLFVCAVF